MEGISPSQESVESGTKNSSISAGGRAQDPKEFLRRFVDSQILTTHLENWYEGLIETSGNKPHAFEVPFELIDIQKFDYALEGIPFQQLIRMPSAVYASTSNAKDATTYLALEDFLHASTNGLWEAFWAEDEHIPFYISFLNDANLRFYQAEQAIAKGKIEGLCAAAIMLKNPRHPQGKWDDVLELVLVRPDIGNLASKEKDYQPSLSIIGEALFFALRVMLARNLSRSNIPDSLNSVFVLLVDSQYGGVIKVDGDVSKLDFDVDNIYQCAAEWIKNHSSISLSPIDRIWNKLGNANWGDIGALQVLYATFNSIRQYAGVPKNSIEDLAADHSSRLQARRIERQLGDSGVNGGGLFRFQQHSASPEIVEVQEEPIRVESKKSIIKLDVGSVLYIEDSNSQKGYQIDAVLNDGKIPYYIASLVDDARKPLFLYVGSLPSQLEPAWEDMELWYQVQRQTKVLSLMKQKGFSSKYLPQLSSSGRIVHPGQCRRPSSGGNCDHVLSGTPILVTTPAGRTIADMVRNSEFGTEEAIRCCHDCLSALSSTAAASVRHGDIRPENIIYVTSGVGQSYFVLTGWGHAILEERDRPVLNLHFSSTSALEEGKLCSVSDAESLVYMLYFSAGGDLPDLDSVEGALKWREKSWSKRLIQQTLGDISAVLKAFADYVDSLCGTPYPMDYAIWMRRLKRHIDEVDPGKAIDNSS